MYLQSFGEVFGCRNFWLCPEWALDLSRRFNGCLVVKRNQTMSEIVCLLVVLASYLIGIFYFAMLVTDADWHSVPTMWHCPFYISIVMALVCHAVTVGWLLAARASPFVVMASCVALVALSMAWLPLARRGATNAISKWWTRVVLFASTAPLIVLSVLAWLESDDAGAVSTYPVIHALILNAGVYGFYFV